MRGYSSGIVSQAHSPDGKWTAQSYPEVDGNVELLDRRSNRVVAVINRHPRAVQSLSFSRDSEYLATSCEKLMCVWDLSAKIPVMDYRFDRRASVPFLAFVPGSDGESSVLMTSHFFSIYHEKTIRREGGKFEEITSWEEPRQAATAVSGDGKILARIFDRQPLQLWDLQARSEIRAPILETEGNSLLALSFNGDRLAVRYGKGLNVFDTRSVAKIAEFPHQGDSINDIAFDPKSSLLASAIDNGTIRIWNLADRGAVATLNQFGSAIAIAFSPTASIFATLTCNGTVRFWDSETWTEIASFNAGETSGRKLSFSPDGNFLIAVADGKVRYWQLKRNSG